MAQIPDKNVEEVRFLTFNVNGLRTFFHYHPFNNMNNSLAKVFDHFKSDIITFQELKTDLPALTRWGKVKGYYSFISIPVSRRGYSGVGCWIRIPDPEDPLFKLLEVVKAEEGITGFLDVKFNKSRCRYRDNEMLGIGGYESLGIEDAHEALALDSEGRCVMVELQFNVVVINVYCPANSMDTDQGEEFRLKFLKVLFRRIRNLRAAGKTIVLMGDINVCRDLIDQSASLKVNGITVTSLTKGTAVEAENPRAVKNFIYAPARPARRLLNEMLADSVLPHLATTGTLIDTTREVQGRDRMQMYTVWNTLKNMRPINYGSRVDYILVSKESRDMIRKSDIWPHIMGSDHCPVFADLRLNTGLRPGESDRKVSSVVPFEAKYKYGLNHMDITSMFSRVAKPAATTNTSIKDQKRIHKPTIATVKERNLAPFQNLQNSPSPHDVMRSSEDISTRVTPAPLVPANRSESFFTMLNGMLEKPPQCKHNENAIMRTSKTSANPGKKFWVCARPNGAPADSEASCGFFQWKT
ncbi:LADA_0F09186g1_1 [Lachancea dasiensis]|uniref:DNA-(apurinic or apyrimidinic site) endonuclease 2 n=1 Tax=Lachancea dasiensis TaxID=1072105 RepID=A0A1G4JL51_9SACH|nr:LADA_0F09186g1_1 [Lachancea dasiensis]